tara:strand:+ start:1043 stop:1225 length:183 start_codon:yes stop_codon:yes gene_type:complete
MSLVFFGVGFLLFSIYLIFLIWNLFYYVNKQNDKKNTNLGTSNSDNIDLDGIGNQGRVPN